MIVQTTITIDGNEFMYTYSDDDRYVVNGDGVAYESAIDPLDSGRTYTEGEKIESEDTAEDILSILLGEEEPE